MKVKEQQHKRTGLQIFYKSVPNDNHFSLELFEKTYKKQIVLKEEFQNLYLSIFKISSFIENLSLKYLNLF